MKAVFRENLGEALVGLAVVLLAGFFIVFAWRATGGAHGGGIKVTALFPNASGVNVGTDVRVAGLKVGQVTQQTLDPQSYQVAVTLALDPSVRLPADSSAAITSEGLLGSTFIALSPGGAEQPLKNGDTISDTQGAMDLMALIGQFINKPSAAPPSADQATGAGTTP
ncbi:outer membrane lipid asymmetry maintenance protein MlaD [Sphingomonas bacterium]|uniref:outer membrane lipid asymmetry maintenance protein MlaD n=1 Tax=Sphingomonas bacterium TaxID=1895847 RepID=UPI00157639FA|nr:outer membrane lipid asymmetry maintenance protein MlaD [Sphingomonas bacterium]